MSWQWVLDYRYSSRHVGMTGMGMLKNIKIGIIYRTYIIYNTALSHSLVSFYSDLHHKLIRWRLATHGGIDGYSRLLIVYLKFTSNIWLTTIYDSFVGAVREHHLPSRVRSDQGGENVLMAQHMIEQRGSDHGSMIVGSSVHNQHIVFRRICTNVLQVFITNFFTLWSNVIC